MATSYSANQYDNAFVSKRLKSWEVPKYTETRPKLNNSVTRPITDDNGRLLSGTRRENSARSNFVGTWDMPKKLPGNRIDNPTARDQQAYDKLRQTFEESKLCLTGQKFNYRTQKQTSQQLAETNGQRDDLALDGIVSAEAPAAEIQAIQTNGLDSAQDQCGQLVVSNKIPVPDFSKEYELNDPVLAGL